MWLPWVGMCNDVEYRKRFRGMLHGWCILNAMDELTCGRQALFNSFSLVSGLSVDVRQIDEYSYRFTVKYRQRVNQDKMSYHNPNWLNIFLAKKNSAELWYPDAVYLDLYLFGNRSTNSVKITQVSFLNDEWLEYEVSGTQLYESCVWKAVKVKYEYLRPYYRSGEWGQLFF